MRAGQGSALVAASLLAAALAGLSGSAGASTGDQDPGDPLPGRSEAVRPGESVSTVRIGPFVLPPAGSPELPVVNQFRPQVPKPCEGCYITAISPRLVHADGRRADMTSGVMLHHLLIAEPGLDDATCARTDGLGSIGRRLFASGDERTRVTLPDGFGFQVAPGPWVALMDLMNSGDVERVVYFEADVHHVPASTPEMRPVTPVWLDMDNCRSSMYTVPAGRSATSWSWTSTLTGRIVYAHGHVHAGGQGTAVDNATSGQRICGSRAGYGDGALAGMVTSMSTCSWDSLGAVRAGDRLTMTSFYDAPRAMDDVMGIMLLAVYETDEVDGGTAAPARMRATPTTRVPGSATGEHGGHDTGRGSGGAGPPGH